MLNFLKKVYKDIKKSVKVIITKDNFQIMRVKQINEQSFEHKTNLNELLLNNQLVLIFNIIILKLAFI